MTTGTKITNGNYPAYYYPEHVSSGLWWDKDRWMTKDPENVLLFLTENDALNWATFNGWKAEESAIKTIRLNYAIQYKDDIWQTYRYAITLDAATAYFENVVLPKLGNNSPFAQWRIVSAINGELVMMLRGEGSAYG